MKRLAGCLTKEMLVLGREAAEVVEATGVRPFRYRGLRGRLHQKSPCAVEATQVDKIVNADPVMFSETAVEVVASAREDIREKLNRLQLLALREGTTARFLRWCMGIMKIHRIAYATVPLLALLITAGTASAMEGRAWGDIHVQTMDGATYDFQAAGEYAASRSTDGDFEVQLRLESTGFSRYVSIVTAVAVLVDTTRASVALGRESVLFVDEQPMTLPRDGVLELPEGGRIERAKRGYEIYWSDGSILSIDVRKRHLNAFLRPAETRRSTLSGLFGNFNGIAADDVEASIANLGSNSDTQLRAGLTELARTLLADDEDERLLAQEESLFEYEPGQSTFSFRRPTPTREATAATLSASWRRRAKEACEEAGVTDPDLLEACIVDVGYTRDESFAETAVAVQARNVSNWDSEVATR